jgi:hypothetical protein
MRIDITEQQYALLSKRKAVLDECSAVAKTAQQCAEIANGALGDVISHCANLNGTEKFNGFQFGKDAVGYFLDLREPEKPL